MIFSSVHIQANVINDGSVCMSARDLLDRVRKMPTDTKTDTYVGMNGNGDIYCVDKSRKHHIPTMNVELFPLVQMPESYESSVKVPSIKIRELFNKTWFAVSDDHSQPNIYNSYIIFDGSNIQMISFDGYRLAFTEQEFDKQYETISIPYKAVMFIKNGYLK